MKLKVIIRSLAVAQSVLSICVLTNLMGAEAVGDQPVDIFNLKAKSYAGTNLVKEWALKAIDSKLPLHIVSMTANKYGVYALVKNVETKLVPPKKLSEMTEQEREKEINKMKWNFGRVLTDEERRQKPGTFGKVNELESFWVQQYSEDGEFKAQWNGTSADYRFVKPDKIASDEFNNLYFSDYAANKISKFSYDGKYLTAWKIDNKKGLNEEIELFGGGGLVIFRNKYVYVVNEPGFDAVTLAKYDVSGNILEKIGSKKDFWVESAVNDQPMRIGDHKFTGGKEERFKILDLTISKTGELFLLDIKLNIVCKLGREGQIEKWYPVVLNDGFDSMLLHPMRWKAFKEMDVRKLNTAMGETEAVMYRPCGITSRDDELFIPLRGIKPFGLLDSIIVDAEKGTLKYFKQPKRSVKKDFGKEKMPYDLNVIIAFHDRDMYLGRTVCLEDIHRSAYPIIQKHHIKEK
jgi:hypothetical protein